MGKNTLPREVKKIQQEMKDNSVTLKATLDKKFKSMEKKMTGKGSTLSLISNQLQAASRQSQFPP